MDFSWFPSADTVDGHRGYRRMPRKRESTDETVLTHTCWSWTQGGALSSGETSHVFSGVLPQQAARLGCSETDLLFAIRIWCLCLVQEEQQPPSGAQRQMVRFPVSSSWSAISHVRLKSADPDLSLAPFLQGRQNPGLRGLSPAGFSERPGGNRSLLASVKAAREERKPGWIAAPEAWVPRFIQSEQAGLTTRGRVWTSKQHNSCIRVDIFSIKHQQSTKIMIQIGCRRCLISPFNL